MRVTRNRTHQLLIVVSCLCCESCSNSDKDTPKNVSVAQKLNEQEAIELVKEEMARQKPFGIESIDEAEYEIDASVTDNGGWLVMFNRLPASPGGYFFAIMKPDGKVQFWPGH